MSLTGCTDTDRLVLLLLDPKEIHVVSQTCKELYNLCDQTLWGNLIKRDFKVTHYYPPFNEQYKYLSRATLEKSLEDGRIDALELFDRKDPVCLYEAEQAILYGHLDLLKWILAQGVKLPSPSDPVIFNLGPITNAIISDSVEIFEYIWRLGFRPVDDDLPVFSIPMVLKLIEFGIYPTVYWADWACGFCLNELLEFYSEKGILPTVVGANSAAEGGCLKTLNWLSERGILPDKEGANLAASSGHLKVLEWLYSKFIYPSRDYLDNVCYIGALDCLIWVEKIGLGIPDEDGLESALENRQYHVAEWIIERGVRLTRPLSKWISEEGKAWAESRQIVD